MVNYCPSYASYFGFLGAASALVFGNMGAAYGTWKSAIGMAAMAKLPKARVQNEMVIKSMLPVIMAGVCGIYGLIIAVIISNSVIEDAYSLFSGCARECAASGPVAMCGCISLENLSNFCADMRTSERVWPSA